MPTDDPRPRDETELVPVRRRPDLVRFLVSGAVVGAVIGGVIAYLGPDAPSSSLLQEVILLASTGALLVGLVAAVLYLVVDQRSMRG